MGDFIPPEWQMPQGGFDPRSLSPQFDPRAMGPGMGPWARARSPPPLADARCARVGPFDPPREAVQACPTVKVKWSVT